MAIYIDLSEFLTNPITTGIQRIAGEVCKYAPPGQLIPIRIHAGRYVAFSTELIRRIGTYFRDGSHSGAADIHRLGDPNNGSAITIAPDERVLVPEVFDNAERLAYFRHMPAQQLEQYRFIVFDLLPLTRPEFFWTDKVGIHEYFKLIRRATNCGFISDDTREVYYARLKRTGDRGGVVLPLGADSLGPRIVDPPANRPLTFSVIGTVEPRKNPELIVEAFEPLLRQIKGLSVSFIGKMGWVSSPFAQKVRALAQDSTSGFRFYSAPSDDALRTHIEKSRATIYVSAAEGYGLPPVESLWLGTPVIASRVIPSLRGLKSTAGIHFVEPLDVVNLRRAVLAFIDDAYANRKAKETALQALPTWRSFAEETLSWCA